MNYQEAFNRAYLGLKAQGRTASAGYSCFYYSENIRGLTCAVGQMIPNEEDRKLLETARVGSIESLSPYCDEYRVLELVMTKAGLEITDWKTDKTFLVDVQNAHDKQVACDKRKFSQVLENLRNVAKKYNLTVPGEEA